MGIELTQTLFVGEHTLLLEGPSDLIYLSVFGELARAQDLAAMDPRWVAAPVGRGWQAVHVRDLAGRQQAARRRRGRLQH